MLFRSHAKEEGIIFKFLSAPKKFTGDESGRVASVICAANELGDPDSRGRRSPVEIPNSDFEILIDCAIIAIGTSPNPLIRQTTQGLETTKNGCIVVNEDTFETTRENIYAGGDIVSGAATVILAMGAGKTAANAIDNKLSKNEIPT